MGKIGVSQEAKFKAASRKDQKVKMPARATRPAIAWYLCSKPITASKYKPKERIRELKTNLRLLVKMTI